MQQFNVSCDDDADITVVEDLILDDLNGRYDKVFSTKYAVDGRDRVIRADRGVLSGGNSTGATRVNHVWTSGQTGNWTGLTNDLNGDSDGLDMSRSITC